MNQMEMFPAQLLEEGEVASLIKLVENGAIIRISNDKVDIHQCARNVCASTFSMAYHMWQLSKASTEHLWETTFYDPCGRNEYKCIHCKKVR